MHTEITRALIDERVRERQDAAIARGRIHRLVPGRRVTIRVPRPRVAWSS